MSNTRRIRRRTPPPEAWEVVLEQELLAIRFFREHPDAEVYIRPITANERRFLHLPTGTTARVLPAMTDEATGNELPYWHEYVPPPVRTSKRKAKRK